MSLADAICACMNPRSAAISTRLLRQWKEKGTSDQTRRFVQLRTQHLEGKGVDVLRVERRSEKSISDSYVHAISSGNIGNPSLDKLSALARGLGVTETQLFFAA